MQRLEHDAINVTVAGRDLNGSCLVLSVHMEHELAQRAKISRGPVQRDDNIGLRHVLAEVDSSRRVVRVNGYSIVAKGQLTDLCPSYSESYHESAESQVFAECDGNGKDKCVPVFDGKSVAILVRHLEASFVLFHHLEFSSIGTYK